MFCLELFITLWYAWFTLTHMCNIISIAFLRFYVWPRLLLFFDDLHFVDYVAYRNHETGSIFIRTLVATFYKLAGQMDVDRLSKMVESSITSHTSRRHALHNE